MNRKILPWLVMASGLTAFPVLAQNMTDYDLLVGAYTQGKSEGIYRYRFDSKTGQIDATPRQVIKSENPSWLTLSKNQRLLFAVNENGPGQTDTVGKVSSFAINGKSHEVTPINQVDSKGDEPTHSSLSADGHFLFVANYAVHPDPGGVLAVVPIVYFLVFSILTQSAVLGVVSALFGGAHIYLSIQKSRIHAVKRLI